MAPPTSTKIQTGRARLTARRPQPQRDRHLGQPPAVLVEPVALAGDRLDALPPVGVARSSARACWRRSRRGGADGRARTRAPARRARAPTAKATTAATKSGKNGRSERRRDGVDRRQRGQDDHAHRRRRGAAVTDDPGGDGAERQRPLPGDRLRSRGRAAIEVHRVGEERGAEEGGVALGDSAAPASRRCRTGSPPAIADGDADVVVRARRYMPSKAQK